jgi:tetratricopeptide (TPR) repeat protein
MTQVDGTAFVVKEDGRMRLLAMEQVLAPMGIEALERSEKGDLDGARTLLDWTREILTPAGGDDPFSGAAFPRLWPPADKADAAAARAAAASLMIHPSVAARSIAALRPARDEALGERRLHLEWALAMACVSAKDWPCTRESASALTAAHPDSEAAFSLYQLALWSLEEVKAAAEHAEARLARKAGDASATRSLSSLAASAGRFDEADRLLRGLADRGSATPGDFNNLAWYALFRPPVGEPAFEDARRAVEAQKRQNSFSLHTLACLEAEVGRTAEARNALLQSIEMAGRDDPASYDWYVIGRLCEHYGELDSAADAYRRISRPEPREAAYSTWELARRRLEGLPKSARPPATSPRPRAGA